MTFDRKTLVIPEGTKFEEKTIITKGDVVIGEGSWLGIGTSVLSGVKIGKNSVIGANSVVTKNIPPYSIAVGSPCKVVKKILE